MKKGNINKIEVLEDYSKDYVYDITVKDNHNYFANNALVHNCIVADESHLISDYSMSSKIKLMLGAHGYYQIIELGVAMFKNHFHAAFNDKEYVRCMCDWEHADRLKESGIFKYTDKDGVYHEYPQYVLSIMPPEAKKKYFPDRPDLITGNSGINNLDFMMQYELQWLDEINLFLNETQQKQLLAGNFNLINSPLPGSTYIFGLDTAGGNIDQETLTLDYTSLSIWEYRADKLIRMYGQQWQGDPILQYEEIKKVLQLWRCSYGLIDFSNIAINFVAMFKKDGINCDGIQYARTCPESHKDYKTTIFDNFLAKLNLDQLMYPNIDDIEEKNPTISKDVIENFKEGFYQWSVLQRIKSKKSDRVKIEAPSGQKDDITNSDSLCIFALNSMPAINNSWIANMPFIVSGATLLSGQGGGARR